MQRSEDTQTEADGQTLAGYVHIFFMDGVGLGSDDAAVNPFVSAHLPHLTGLLGQSWYLEQHQTRSTERATLVPTNATMGVAGRPQSATGQATILTGHNVPRLIGRHYGPKPNDAVADIVRSGSLFQEVVTAGGTAALITPYPQQYFEAIDSGRRLFSAVPLAATSAGLSLMTADDLQEGRAVSPSFTGEAWRNHLGYEEIPLLTPEAAGRQIASIARRYNFSFFEHWPSDYRGHRGTLQEAVQHLERLDAALGGLFAAWDGRGLLIITSDHGNIENKSHRRHTKNPVPTILIGPRHPELASMIDNLSDIARVVRRHLALDCTD